MKSSSVGDLILTTNLEKRGLLDIHYAVGDEKSEYIVVFPHAGETGHAWFCFFDKNMVKN